VPDLFKRLKGDSFRGARFRAIVATVCGVLGTVMGKVEIYAIGAWTDCVEDVGGYVGIPYGLLNGLSATMAFFTLVSEWMCLTVMDRAKARLAESELKWDGMDTVNR
jgi:cytosine/uracil/thiamine/allantoin permease